LFNFLVDLRKHVRLEVAVRDQDCYSLLDDWSPLGVAHNEVGPGALVVPIAIIVKEAHLAEPHQRSGNDLLKT